MAMASWPTRNWFESPRQHRLQVRRVNAHDRQVRVRVSADEMRIRPATVGERDFNPLRAMHHVAVRENKTIRRDDETRTAATVTARGARCFFARQSSPPTD